MIKKAWIVAARDDGFGARLCAILNAMYLAKKVGLVFKFRYELPPPS